MLAIDTVFQRPHHPPKYPAPSCAAPASPARYQRHRPEETTRCRVVQAHLDTYLAPIFHPAAAPTHAELAALLGKIITRLLRLLTRMGHLVEAEGEIYLVGCVTDPDDVMTPLQAAAANYRIAHCSPKAPVRDRKC